MRYSVILLLGMGVVGSCCPVLRAADQIAATDSHKTRVVDAHDHRISLIKNSDGLCSLLVDCPWKAYAKPSVEVWLLPTGESLGGVRPKPLYFAAHYLRGDISARFGECLAAAYGVGVTEPIKIEYEPLTFDFRGYRNSLGRPAVCVVRDIRPGEGKPDEGPQMHLSQLGVWAAFCELENWAANQHQLRLDLPREYFNKSGKLYVWFLRGDKPLWEEQLDWKGYPADKP